MNTKWIVVADRTKARVFRETPFSLIKTLENDLGREKNKALRNDKPGWSGAAFYGSAAIHAMDGEKNPHEEAAIQFARRLCRYLEHESQTHRFDGLLIAAEAKMMGRIRTLLAKHLAEKTRWLRKDLGHCSTHQISEILDLKRPRGCQAGRWP